MVLLRSIHLVIPCHVESVIFRRSILERIRLLVMPCNLETMHFVWVVAVFPGTLSRGI